MPKQELGEAQLQELQRAYMEMQQIDGQMKQATQQVAVLDQQIAEIHDISQNVAELGGVKSGTELFVPLANGIFVKATVGETKELLVNVGAGVVVPKPVADVRSLLDEQVQRVAATKEQLTSHMAELGKHAKTVEAKLKKMIEA